MHTGVNHSQHLYIQSYIQVSTIPNIYTYCRTYRCQPFPTPIHRLMSYIQVTTITNNYTCCRTYRCQPFPTPIHTVVHTGVNHPPHPYIGYCRTYRCQPFPTSIHTFVHTSVNHSQQESVMSLRLLLYEIYITAESNPDGILEVLDLAPLFSCASNNNVKSL